MDACMLQPARLPACLPACLNASMSPLEGRPAAVPASLAGLHLLPCTSNRSFSRPLLLPPQVPLHEDLPTGTFSGEAEYLGLMHECWAQDPASRPTFTAVISRLRKMLALEASIRRESPTKVGRPPSGYSLMGDETPGSRSRLASLTAISDLSPEPRSSGSMVAALGEESDTDVISNHSLSASPSQLGSARPPRHRNSTDGAEPPAAAGGAAAALNSQHQQPLQQQ